MKRRKAQALRRVWSESMFEGFDDEGCIKTYSQVVAIERQGDLWRVTTSRGNYLAPIIVNAAGAWADQVATLAGIEPFGLRSLRRTAFTFTANVSNPHTWPMFKDADETFYCKPYGDGFFASPAEAVPEPPGDAQVRPEVVDER